MSLVGFQRALVDFVLHPDLVRAVAAGQTSRLLDYDLSERDMRRLCGIATQRGIWLCCSLARANRFEAVAEIFPMTCVLLQPQLRDLLDEIWSAHPPANYQFSGEEALFITAVEIGLGSGRLDHPYLPEVFRYEQACWELAQRLRGTAADDAGSMVVVFAHPPDQLLEPLSRLTAPPANLPHTPCTAEIRLVGGRFCVEVLQAPKPPSPQPALKPPSPSLVSADPMKQRMAHEHPQCRPYSPRPATLRRADDRR